MSETTPADPKYLLGQRIWRAREDLGWSRAKVAQVAEKLRADALRTAGRRPCKTPIDDKKVELVEKQRQSVRFGDLEDAFPYVMRAVGLGADELAEAVGLPTSRAS